MFKNLAVASRNRLNQVYLSIKKLRSPKVVKRRNWRKTKNTKVDDSMMDRKLYNISVLKYFMQTGRSFEHVVNQRRPLSNVPLLRYENNGNLKSFFFN
jgi:hypothetical protein